MPIPGCLCSSISIRAPRMGSDNNGILHIAPDNHFNPRSPHGERPRRNRKSSRSSIFQSTPPAWGATSRPISSPLIYSYFNPRPRMGSDVRKAREYACRFISIHAPAWGATRPCGSLCKPFHISIHAPAWGATWFFVFSLNVCKFQSTPPHGERHEI